VFTDLHKIPWFVFGVVPVALGLWFWKKRRQAFKVLLVAAVAIAVSDGVSYRILKPRIGRLRPGRAGVTVIERAPISGVWSFPSNHAVNVGAASTVLSVAYPGWTVIYVTISLIVAYSRVYVGAHYPADVMAGLLLGAAIAWPWAMFMLRRKGPSQKKRR
jgi:undecaprenyl-diphosphatase